MRHNDWPERLAAFIDERRRVAFRWGESDCALFAADWVCEATGADPAAQWRGYASEAEAQAIIEQAGGMRALVSLPQRPAPAFAQRGDVVLAEHEGRELFGVVVGGGSYAAPGARGLEFRPMSEVLIAFEV